MAGRVDFSARARAQLRSINRYIGEAADADTAESFVARIVNRCLRIADVPHGGTSREDLGRGIRSVPFDGRTTILYRVRGEIIVIAAVFYGGQDVVSRFRRRSR